MAGQLQAPEERRPFPEKPLMPPMAQGLWVPKLATGLPRPQTLLGWEEKRWARSAEVGRKKCQDKAADSACSTSKQEAGIGDPSDGRAESVLALPVGEFHHPTSQKWGLALCPNGQLTGLPGGGEPTSEEGQHNKQNSRRVSLPRQLLQPSRFLEFRVPQPTPHQKTSSDPSPIQWVHHLKLVPVPAGMGGGGVYFKWCHQTEFQAGT